MLKVAAYPWKQGFNGLERPCSFFGAEKSCGL